MNCGKNLMQSFMSDKNLGTELLPGVPIVEICDQRRVLIENHQGIVGYDCNEIQIKVHYGRICVCGEKLRMSRMNKSKLVITGRIRSINLQGRG